MHLSSHPVVNIAPDFRFEAHIEGVALSWEMSRQSRCDKATIWWPAKHHNHNRDQLTHMLWIEENEEKWSAVRKFTGLANLLGAGLNEGLVGEYRRDEGLKMATVVNSVGMLVKTMVMSASVMS